MASRPGTLFVVATPIGNLEDITLRALRVLREVALIAAEDTRRTARLLAHFGITTPVQSFHAHSEHERAPALLARLGRGESVALVTDAGTPLVSDPGAGLVRAARAAGAPVVAIPGPSAVLTALVSSGLPAESFVFLGFAPSRAQERRAWLRRVAAEPHTVVFFEAPHRVRDTLGQMAELFPDRPVGLARELTKVHEEILTGLPGDLLNRLDSPKGEFTVVVGPGPEPLPAAAPPDDASLWREFCELIAAASLSRRQAVTTLARRHGQPAREIYAALERGRSAERSER